MRVYFRKTKSYTDREMFSLSYKNISARGVTKKDCIDLFREAIARVFFERCLLGSYGVEEVPNGVEVKLETNYPFMVY